MKRILIPATAEVPNYTAALAALGAEPVPARTYGGLWDCDALLLPGGGDLDPARYGEAVDGSRWIDPALDELQFETLEAFLRAGRPVFGICRGHQLLNVRFGGTLIQHIPQWESHKGPARGVDNVHPVVTEPASFLAGLYGERFSVNSAHHQAVGRVGEGFRVIQRAEDGVVEAMAHETRPIWTVQWHPERMCLAHRREDTVDGSLVLAWFLEQI